MTELVWFGEWLPDDLGVSEWVPRLVKGLVGKRGLAYSEISRGSPDFRPRGALAHKSCQD
jgi:hypothetical protein